MAVISTHCASPDVYTPAGHYSYCAETGQGGILQEQNSQDQTKLYQLMDELLHRKAQTTQPTHNSSLDLANQFCAFLGQKLMDYDHNWMQ